MALTACSMTARRTLAGLAGVLLLTVSTSAEQPYTPTISIDLSGQAPSATGIVSPMIFGSNMSYFNDLDEVWEAGDLANKMRSVGIGTLRYPGGEETSRFHWEHPGVNGYVDLWNQNHHKQTWQSTWVPKEEWDTNESFMDFDEFIQTAREVGATPLVGINMSSGYKLDRTEDSIAEAVRWVEYAKDKGYEVEWWYLDNEPWHKHDHNYIHIPLTDYAELCVRFAKAMREVDPDAKFIVNPLDGSEAGNWPRIEEFMDIAGDHIDVLEFHWYWEFGAATFERFISSRPLRDSASWEPYWEARTYAQRIRSARSLLDEHGYEHVKLGSLEWNAGTARGGPSMDERQLALVHGEFLMQFIDGGLDMACIWPGFYQIRDVDHDTEQRAWFEYDQPHNPRAPIDVVRMLTPATGGTVWRSDSLGTDARYPTLAVRSADGTTLFLYILNKDRDARSATITLGEWASTSSIPVHSFSIDPSGSTTSAFTDEDRLAAELPAFSLTRFDIPLARQDSQQDSR